MILFIATFLAQFQKMMGKHNRGKEAIDIIDVNADEQLGPNPGTEWMLKSMTEEKEYRGNLVST